MKKPVKAILFLFVIAVVVTSVIVCSTSKFEPSEYYTESDRNLTATDFEETVQNLYALENTWDTALPQTEIYNLISEHFSSPLPKGKKEKKAIVIGYDGCRVDTLTLLATAKEKKSGINLILNDRGHGVFSYCGGVNYPAENTQDTSTAPGWCSMLTGVLADKHGVYENGHPKEVEPKTLLLSLVESKHADSSAFYVSWKGHFTNKDATYVNEVEYAEKNKLPVTFLRAEDDEGTKANVLKDINSGDKCSDFIFLTLEYTDHSGHNTGFSLGNPVYVNGFREADAAGAEFIQAIKARETYDKEDWLIIITTDHGGIKKKHGGPSMEERITFIIANKELM